MGETKSKSKKVLWIIGTILLGAIGSGLWNTVLSPFLTILMNYILNTVSLGIGAIKNSVYLEIAKGLHENAAVSWLDFSSGFIMGLPLTGLIIYLIEASPKQRFDKFKEKIIKNNKVKVTLLLLLFFVVSFYSIGTLFVHYENNAITHFHQSLTICKPFIDLDKEENIQSRFALIKNKEDYVKILSDLSEIAKKNGKELPKFTPW